MSCGVIDEEMEEGVDDPADADMECAAKRAGAQERKGIPQPKIPKIELGERKSGSTAERSTGSSSSQAVRPVQEASSETEGAQPYTVFGPSSAVAEASKWAEGGWIDYGKKKVEGSETSSQADAAWAVW